MLKGQPDGNLFLREFMCLLLKCLLRAFGFLSLVVAWLCRLDVIDKCFSQRTVEQIISALVSQTNVSYYEYAFKVFVALVAQIHFYFFSVFYMI